VVRAVACGFVLVFGVAVGCAHSRVDAHWGEAQGAVVERMVVDPGAEAAAATPVEGLDPDTGEAVVEKYIEAQGEAREASQLPSIIQIDAGGRR